MKVLVIGGAGYIGSHVALELLDAGHTVTVFDNLSTGTTDNLFKNEGFIQGDILDPAALEKAMSGTSGRAINAAGVTEESVADGYDALVHLAAAKAAGESMTNPEKYSVQNLTGTINIINAAAKAGIKIIIFSSSAATYGEPAYLPIDEKHPTNPENFYGFTKLEIERILAWYDKLKAIRFAALRYFNAAGYDVKGRISGLEKNPANLIPVIMEVAAGRRKEIAIFGTDYPTPDGSGVRDYVHVSDLARAHVAALEKIAGGSPSFVVNLGSESGISVLEILEAARRITGKEIPAKISERRPGDPAKLVASSALAHELLGWESQYSDVDTLVATTWEAYRKHSSDKLN